LILIKDGKNGKSGVFHRVRVVFYFRVCKIEKYVKFGEISE